MAINSEKHEVSSTIYESVSNSKRQFTRRLRKDILEINHKATDGSQLILKSSLFFRKNTRSNINECGMSTSPFNFLEFSSPAFPFNMQYFLLTH